MLGQGGFGTVYEVRAVYANELTEKEASTVESNRETCIKSHSSRSFCKDMPDKELDTGETESRRFIAKHCIRNGGDARYAVKVLSLTTTKAPVTHWRGENVLEVQIGSNFEPDL